MVGYDPPLQNYFYNKIVSVSIVGKLHDKIAERGL
jgi:hypothetical protein